MIERKLSYEESHKEIEGVLHKLCKICEEWFPCTDEYFYNKKNKSKDRLSPYCRKCESKKNTQWGQSNRDKMRGYYRKNNKTEVTKQRKYLFSKHQKDSGIYLEWQQNNKDKIKQYQENRKQHGEHKINKKEWVSCKEYFNNECAYCGLPIDKHYNKFAGEMRWTDLHKEHVDHDGLNDLSNCIPSCKTCNSSKYTSILEDWYIENNPNFNQERLDKIYKWLNEDYKLYINKSQ
jgi:uncharacterized protein YuzB (UPF0349 family)